MNTLYKTGIFLFVAATAMLASESLAASVWIADIRWAYGVSASREVFGGELKTPVSAGKPLYLWVEMRGDAEAFEILKAKRKLTLVHKWEYTHFGWKTERIDVSIGRDEALDDETIQKLGYEIDAQGYFEWRTWSKKDHLYAHAYTVSIVDGFDEPFACKAETGCDMTIEVQ